MGADRDQHRVTTESAALAGDRPATRKGGDMQGPNFGGSSSQWDEYAERIRRQLPTAPDSLIDIYVKWAPWIAMIFGAIGLFLSIGFLFLGALVTPFLVLGGGSGVNAGIGLFVAIAL